MDRDIRIAIRKSVVAGQLFQLSDKNQTCDRCKATGALLDQGNGASLCLECFNKGTNSKGNFSNSNSPVPSPTNRGMLHKGKYWKKAKRMLKSKPSSRAGSGTVDYQEEEFADEEVDAAVNASKKNWGKAKNAFMVKSAFNSALNETYTEPPPTDVASGPGYFQVELPKKPDNLSVIEPNNEEKLSTPEVYRKQSNVSEDPNARKVSVPERRTALIESGNNPNGPILTSSSSAGEVSRNAKLRPPDKQLPVAPGKQPSLAMKSSSLTSVGTNDPPPAFPTRPKLVIDTNAAQSNRNPGEALSPRSAEPANQAISPRPPISPRRPTAPAPYTHVSPPSSTTSNNTGNTPAGHPLSKSTPQPPNTANSGFSTAAPSNRTDSGKMLMGGARRPTIHTSSVTQAPAPAEPSAPAKQPSNPSRPKPPPPKTFESKPPPPPSAAKPVRSSQGTSATSSFAPVPLDTKAPNPKDVKMTLQSYATVNADEMSDEDILFLDEDEEGDQPKAYVVPSPAKINHNQNNDAYAVSRPTPKKKLEMDTMHASKASAYSVVESDWDRTEVEKPKKTAPAAAKAYKDSSAYFDSTLNLEDEIEGESDDDDSEEDDKLEEDAYMLNTGDDDEEESRSGDWNQRFQTIMETMNDVECSISNTAYLQLIGLAQDFLYAAMSYGKIIISEVYLDDLQKTIKPVQVGGVAGGSKYIVQDILFKFALDTQGLYKDDEVAAKVGGHELKGLQAYFNCDIPNLSLPLMAIVDYRGFRLIAIAILPIDEGTIIYGSCDGGRTIHDDDPKFAPIMQRASEILNIRPHMAGLYEEHRRVLYSAADIEGHKGKDGRYYLVDFSRTFPCQTVNREIQGSNLARLLRPEFVKSYEEPLCSDAYTNFCATKHCKAVDEATQYLFNTTIPNLGKKLPDILAQSGQDIKSFRLTELIHSHGVNVRFLGRLYACLDDVKSSYVDVCRVMLLIEMFARIVKTKLRAQLRAEMKRLKKPLAQPYHKLVVGYLNLVIGQNSQSDDYWENTLGKHVINYFEGVTNTNLRKLSSHPQAQLKQVIFFPKLSTPLNIDLRCLLLARVQKMTGLKFTMKGQRDMLTNYNGILDRPTPLATSDLEDIGERIKHMNIVSHAEGYLLVVSAIQCRATDPTKAVSSLLASIEKFEQVLNSNANSKVTLQHCAKALMLLDEEIRRAKKIKLDPKSPHLTRARQYLERAIKVDDTDSRVFGDYAEFLHRCGEFESSEDMFLRALELDRSNEEALLGYGALLEERGEYDMAEKLFVSNFGQSSSGGDSSSALQHIFSTKVQERRANKPKRRKVIIE